MFGDVGCEQRDRGGSADGAARGRGAHACPAACDAACCPHKEADTRADPGCARSPGRGARGRVGTEGRPGVSPGHLLLPEPLQGLPAVCGDRPRRRPRVGPPRGRSDAPLRQAERRLLDVQDGDVFHGSVRSAASGGPPRRGGRGGTGKALASTAQVTAWRWGLTSEHKRRLTNGRAGVPAGDG